MCPLASDRLLEPALEAARAGGEILRQRFLDATVKVELKAEHDFVSEVDRASEEAIVATIRRYFPDHGILAEEGGWQGGGGSEYEWLIDPLDGTSNYLQGLPMFAVSIGCRRGEELVAGVILEPLGGNVWQAARGAGATWNGRPIRVSEHGGLDGAFLATGYPFRARRALDLYLEVFRDVFLRARALRRCGSAALDLAHTACGVFDGFFEFRLSAWDIAAGALVIEEAGGRIADLDGGRRFLETGNVVAGGPAVYEELARVVAARASEARLEELAPAEDGVRRAARDPVG